MRLLEHARRRFNQACRDSLFNGPTYLRSVVGQGVICTKTRDELNAPHAEEDRLADEYSRSQTFIDDRAAIAESWSILEENSVDFGTVVMRKLG